MAAVDWDKVNVGSILVIRDGEGPKKAAFIKRGGGSGEWIQVRKWDNRRGRWRLGLSRIMVSNVVQGPVERGRLSDPPTVHVRRKAEPHLEAKAPVLVGVNQMFMCPACHGTVVPSLALRGAPQTGYSCLNCGHHQEEAEGLLNLDLVDERSEEDEDEEDPWVDPETLGQALVNPRSPA